MSSRAKKKRHARGDISEPPPPPRAEPEWDPAFDGDNNPIQLSKRQERWLGMFFTGVLGMGAAGGVVMEVTESWTAGVVAGVAGLVIAVALFRRGVDLFA